MPDLAITKKYLIESLKNFNQQVLSKIYCKIPKNKAVLDKLAESEDGVLLFSEQKIQGIKGDPGINGNDGESSYEIAMRNGFAGTEKEWLNSLHGENGKNAEWFCGTDVMGNATSEIKISVPGSKTGDLYLNTNTYDIYKATMPDTWIYLCNIRGEAGLKGDKGEPGEKGEPGQGIEGMTPEDIGAAPATHSHGDMFRITFSTAEPTAIGVGEIVMVYEE